MIDQPPFSVSDTDARLGDAIFVLVQRRTESIWVQQGIDREIISLLSQRIGALELRIRILEQQTLSAYWRRFLLWCKGFWRG
jgi:hypothetical protein